MKYSVDQSDILEKFPKYLLVYENNYDAIAYLLRDVLFDLGIRIDGRNRLQVVGLFQDVFDILNPYIGNIYSGFDLLYESGDNFGITFLKDSTEYEPGEAFGAVVKYKELKLEHDN